MKKPKTIKIKTPNLVKADGTEIKGKKPGTFEKTLETPTSGVMSYYGALRFTLKETASCLGMSVDSLRKFLKENPNLQSAFDAGHSKALASVSHQAYKIASSGINANATFRWLESNDKDRWLRSHVVETKGDKNKEEELYALKLLETARNPTKE